jgi:hypothetical protein
MASEYSGATAVIPVRNPESGDIHTIAVPSDTSLQDLHAALIPYHHSEVTNAFRLEGDEPTEAGALENTDAFREAARDAIARSGDGQVTREAGFLVGPTGKTIPVPAHDGPHMPMPVYPAEFASLHTHPDNYGPRPSDADIQDAVETKKPYYVSSQQGLFMIRPSDGKVIQVFSSPGWAQKNYIAPVSNSRRADVDSSHFAIEVTLKNGEKTYIDGGKEYPWNAMQALRKSGTKNIAVKDIKQVVAFPPNKT